MEFSSCLASTVTVAMAISLKTSTLWPTTALFGIADVRLTGVKLFDFPYSAWSARAQQVFSSSPRAQVCHSIAEGMHRFFARNVLSIERTSSKAIPIARSMSRTQLCISIAYDNPYTRDGEGACRNTVTTFSTQGGRMNVKHMV